MSILISNRSFDSLLVKQIGKLVRTDKASVTLLNHFAILHEQSISCVRDQSRLE